MNNPNGVDFIVFSKNRALQLRALLESAYHYIVKDSIRSFSIIYTHDQVHKNSYRTLQNEFVEVCWIEEKNFRNQTIEAVNNSGDFVCFLVDDIIFYQEIEEGFIPQEHDVCFSLRLGNNCRYSHPANSFYHPPVFLETEKTLSWEWRGAEFDFGYPFSLDGHVFRKSDILKILEMVDFKNPNSLENSMVYFNPLMSSFLNSSIRSFKTSRLVGIPVNRVNDQVPNRFGQTYNFSEQSLLEIFEKGGKINWMEMSYENIIGPHQELEFKFKTE
jgi:hypothetical protein